jgi:lipopolysaccharide export system permease protein
VSVETKAEVETRTRAPRSAGGRRRSFSLSDLSPWRMRTIDLYVARTFAFSWVICSVSFIGLFVTIEAFAKLDRFLKQDGALLDTLWRYHAAMIPTIFTHYIGPILTAAAGMFTVTLLGRQNELAALRAAGVSTYRMLRPVFLLAIALTGLTLWLQESVLPQHRESIRTALAFSKGGPLSPELFFDAEHGLAIRVKQYSTIERIATGVEIVERHPNLSVKAKTDAERMRWIPSGADEENQGHWELLEGSTQRWNENGALNVNDSGENLERLKSFFERRELSTSMRPIDLEASDLDIAYLSWGELKSQFERQPYHRHLAVKLHLHFAFPLAHILLLVLAIPIVLNLQNRSIIVGVALTTLIGAAFYLLSSICMSIAQDSQFFSPVLAAWLPVMLFGALGITLFDHLPT